MSIHAIKPETEARIRSQQRTSFITSSIIAVLTIILLMLILSLLLLAPYFKESPTIVTYETISNDETELESGGAHAWDPKGTKQTAEWIQSAPSVRNKSLNLVKDSPLIFGTNWEPALEMALAMDPPPQIIFFMTDGITGGDSEALARSIAAKAKANRITINTVAMMEPKAEKAMKSLAKRTGGQFTVIEKNGKSRQVPLD